MEYVEKLRKCVGLDPLVLPGAGVLVVDDQNRVLMIKRSGTRDWGLPGGTMEPGETTEETARRELSEETGLQAGALDFLGVFSGPEQYMRYPNGDEVYNVSVAYIAPQWSGQVNLRDGENTDFGYFPISSPPEPVSQPIKPILRALAQRLTE